ncbi:MAG: hypothetical protein M3160_06105, partial [Candidatus Eremiobacteraeota bacterium]|nr:hypothetical protein [Candidatus Eremiobacteraeota bacterium]
LKRLSRCLDEYLIEGVPTTIPLLRELIDYDKITNNEYTTTTLEEFAVHKFTGATADHGNMERSKASQASGEVVRVEVNDKLFRVRLVDQAPTQGKNKASGAPRLASGRSVISRNGSDTIEAPMHGIVVALMCQEGEAVQEGQVVAIIEAMKMMNEIHAHKPGTVSIVHAKQGESVEAHSPIMTLI